MFAQERKKAYDKAEKLKVEKEEEEKRIIFEENKEIKQLEKQLHMNKRKSKLLPQKFIEEGLDCIFLQLHCAQYFCVFMLYIV